MQSTFAGGTSGDSSASAYYDVDEPVFDAADLPYTCQTHLCQHTSGSNNGGCSSGGGLWIQSGRVTLSDCNIYRNMAVRALRGPRLELATLERRRPALRFKPMRAIPTAGSGSRLSPLCSILQEVC